MSSDWITANIEKIDIKDLELLEKYSDYKANSVFVGFFLSLYPQYTLLTHPFISNYKRNGLLSRLSLVGLMILPFAGAYMASRPFYYLHDNYMSSLKEKYN